MNYLLSSWKWLGLGAASFALVVAFGCSSPSTTSAPVNSTLPSITTASPTISTPPVSTTHTTPSTTAATSLPPTTSTAPADQPVTIALTAKGISFDKSSITVAAGSLVTINFNNADGGIPHNFALYNDSSADTAIFVGQTITGPATMTYQFTAPAKAGTYFFRCDIHPSIMTGAFIVQ
jgi:plastocyanin